MELCLQEKGECRCGNSKGNGSLPCRGHAYGEGAVLAVATGGVSGCALGCLRGLDGVVVTKGSGRPEGGGHGRREG